MGATKPQYAPTEDLVGEGLTLLGSLYVNEWPYVLVETDRGWEVRTAPTHFVGEAIRTVVIAGFFAGFAWLTWDSLLRKPFMILAFTLAEIAGVLGPIVYSVLRGRFLRRLDPQVGYDRRTGRVSLKGGSQGFDRDRVVGVLLLATGCDSSPGDTHTEAQLVVAGENGVERHLIASSLVSFVAGIRSPFLEFCRATGLPLYEASHKGLLGRGAIHVRKLVR